MGFIFIEGKRVHTSCINNEIKMERKVGEVFEYDSIILEVVDAFGNESCLGCYFDTDISGCVHDYFVDNVGSCWFDRSDGKPVIFKEVE